jgi:hypothetical protein
MKRLVTAAVAWTWAAASGAQVVTLESANPAPKQSSDPDRIICERVERTGSRLAVEKVCLSARQWADQKDGHRADLEKVQGVMNQQFVCDPSMGACSR